VLLQYPFDHYEIWRRDISAHPLLEAPGAFGENLSTLGWTEALVHIGYIVRFGKVVLQVSQGRQPCWKLNFRFGRTKLAFDVQNTGRTGWYFRVLEPGVVEPGEAMQIIDRPCPDWPLQRLIGVLYKHVDDAETLQAMAGMPELAEDWRVIARRASPCAAPRIGPAGSMGRVRAEFRMLRDGASGAA
jgi:MOSC domain-containing protein YiiM